MTALPLVLALAVVAAPPGVRRSPAGATRRPPASATSPEVLGDGPERGARPATTAVTPLEQRQPSPSSRSDTSSRALGDAPGLETPLERELWRALVLLEGDVETATRALASCEQSLGELAELPAAPTPPPSSAAPWWVWPVVGVVAFGSGVALGVLLEDHAP